VQGVQNHLEACPVGGHPGLGEFTDSRSFKPAEEIIEACRYRNTYTELYRKEVIRQGMSIAEVI